MRLLCNNRYCILGALLSLLLLAVSFGVAGAPPEPVYGGRPVGDWLDCGYEQAAMALHETGPSAAIVVFSKLRREHPEHGLWAKYRKLWCHTPRLIRHILPAPRIASFDDERACSALLEIGPSVIPNLVTGLKDANPAVRATSAWALGCLHERGSNISLAIPGLIQAHRDSNPDVRRYAAIALGT